MNWQAINFDWNQVRAFLATAEEGSLSAAARALKLTQPTLSRQVAALEEDLGVVLFERGPRTMLLTEAGHQLIEHVRDMGDAATRLSLVALGQSQEVGGTVSITATSMFATHHLPPMLLKLREVAPRIRVNVITSNTVQDLTAREADISIRHARPEQLDLIGKQVAEVTWNLIASKALLNRYGRPKQLADCSALPLIGFETPEMIVSVLKDRGIEVSEQNVAAVTANGNVLVAMVRAGVGASILTRDVLDIFPDLEEACPALEPMPVPVWLVTHRELNTSRRIRVVYDLLAEEIAKL